MGLAVATTSFECTIDGGLAQTVTMKTLRISETGLIGAYLGNGYVSLATKDLPSQVSS